MPLAAGIRIGPYEILTLLGRGGMGEVYVARDQRLGRDVAIKVLRPAYAADADRLRRFDQEARAAAALNHPNILAVYDTGTFEGSPYIVSEILTGQTLRDVLGHGALVTRKAVEYAIALATGLAAAHDKGIVHRDIKPENVFVTDDGRVKILDFGLAKLREPRPGAKDATDGAATADTTESVILGTAGYMSPEQVRGQSLDYRSDIFSLGATLYEMVSGARAFKGDTAVETMSAILKHDPPLLGTSDATIPAPLATVIQHCLEKERDQRFQSAKDLAFALGRLTGTSGSGTLTRIVDRTAKWKPWIVGAVAAALLTAVGGMAYLSRPANLPHPPTFTKLTFRRGFINNARFAPDGQTVISSASWDGKPSEVFSTRLDTQESMPLQLARATLLSVSRSGELALSVKDNVLAQVPIGATGPRDLDDLVVDADWGPDGSLAAVRRDSTGSHGWVEYPRGNKIYDVTHGINTVRISPDGKLIALLEEEMFGGGLQWLTIIDRSGAVRGSSKKKGAAQESSLAWTPDGREVWFTASEVGGHGTVYAMTLDGRERIAYTAMGSVRILDIAPGGRALLANDSFGYRMSLVDMNVVGERDLSWKDWSLPLALSGDGKIVAFGVGGRISANGRIPGFVRPTDGSPAVQLSEDGNPCAFSPDGNWLLTSSPAQSAGGTSSGWTIVPIGTGQARHIDVGHLANTSTFVRWLADDRIVYSGAEPGRPDRLFIQHIAGGPPEAFTPEGVYGPLIVSPDSTRVIVRNEKRQPSMYPVSGGAPTVVAGALPQEQPLAWSADAESIWVLSRATRPAQIFRIELRNGHRSFWREVPYSDPASLTFGLLRVVMSADGSKFVYGYLTRQSELYVAEGLR